MRGRRQVPTPPLTFLNELYNCIMVKIDDKFYQCEECWLHYIEKNIAEECEKFCKKYNACNIKITKYAIENKGYL